jgi:glycosyltransferase involved in cell wall biosynthesis
MACGTPVLAFRHGSRPGVLDEDIIGYMWTAWMRLASGRVLALDRGRVRRRFEQRFTAERMVQDYVKTYEKLINTGLRRGAPPHRKARRAAS